MIDAKNTVRNSIILGFIISCVALLVNAIVLSEVGNRLRDTETAHAALTQSLNEQTKVKDEGEKKFENYRLYWHLASLLPENARANMKYDAGSHFHDFVLYLYAAGNDLPMTEFRRAETEIDLEDASAENQSADSESNENKTAENRENKRKTEDEKFERALKILENPKDESGKTDYKAKHRAITTITDLVTETDDDDLSDARFSRIDTFLNKRYIESYDRKQLKINELSALRESQSKLVSYSVFGSLALQMLGLAFIFLKDFIQDKRA